MLDPGTELLAFINQVRSVQDRDHLRYLVMLDLDVDDEEECILATALGVPVGGSNDPAWSAAGRWVIRFDDYATARIAAICTQQEWLPERLEVELPELLVDFATSAHYGLVEQDDIGFVRAWHVPIDGNDLSKGFDDFWMPGMRTEGVEAVSTKPLAA